MDEFPNMPLNYSFSWTQSYPATNMNFAPNNCKMAVIEAIDRLVEAGVRSPAMDEVILNLTRSRNV